ncbi:MAG: helical backbone metal receptor [Gemmatimonadetes bacterium]|nr:helical backbone metal receptor [Gemmatimonadota bacterium]
MNANSTKLFVRATALSVALPLACAPAPASDDSTETVVATRVVSLLPAATEILFALGAGDIVVGRTRWGVHPEAAREVADVGDGIRPSIEAVLALEPDLVVLYAGPSNAESADRLAALGVRLLPVEHDTLADLENTITVLGEAVGCEASARALIAGVREGLATVSSATRELDRPRAYYDVWGEPPMTLGRGSFIDSLLTIAGAVNVFGDLDASAPRVSLEAIIRRDPDIVVAPVEPEGAPPDLSARAGWAQVGAVAEGRIVAVDRDLVSRLGPRVADAAGALATAIHPELELSIPSPSVSTCRG